MKTFHLLILEAVVAMTVFVPCADASCTVFNAAAFESYCCIAWYAEQPEGLIYPDDCDGSTQTYVFYKGEGDNYEQYTLYGRCIGYLSTDTDCDGIQDSLDSCTTPLGEPVGEDGCPLFPPEEICNDGIDNDGDGRIDCGDTDCSSFDPGCSPRDCNLNIKSNQ